MHVAKRLLERGDTVIGIDNLNNYYDVGLKRSRLGVLSQHAKFSFQLCDVRHNEGVQKAIQTEKFDSVIHLPAQAGVRYSLENPRAYWSQYFRYVQRDGDGQPLAGEALADGLNLVCLRRS